MKRLYIAITIALLLGAASCTELLDPALRESVQQVPEGAKVTLYFGTPVEVTTKAADAPMAVDPTIKSIHVFVFNKEGILVETAEARNAETGQPTFGAVTTNGPGGAKHWSVILTMSGSERRLHFIANLPKDDQGNYLVPEAGSEASIFQSLATTYPEAAYWQRRVLTYGIKAYQYDGSKKYQYVTEEEVIIDNVTYYPGQIVTAPVPSTEFAQEDDGSWSYTDPNGRVVNKDDYIDRKGNKIVSGSGFYAIEEIVEKVPMIRNFACIRVKSTWQRTVNNARQTFTLTQAVLINRPVAGYVAPYDSKQSVDGAAANYNRFVPGYINISEDTRPEAGNLAGYTVSVPAAGIYTDEPAATEFQTEKDNDGFIRMFTYERGIPTSNPTTLLVAGKWVETDDEIWYKIELKNTEGQYFKIMRDFTYDVNITGIEGNDGETSWQKAFYAAPVGDVSNSPETATLEQISDNKGLTLWVSYIDKVLIDSNIAEGNADYPAGQYYTLLYTCFRQKQQGTGYDYFNTTAIDDDDAGNIRLIRQKHPDYPGLPYAIAAAPVDDDEEDESKPLIVAGYPHVVTDQDDVDVPDDRLQWMIVKFKLNKIQTGQGYLRSQIHVEASVTAADAGYDKTLSRDVTYTVMPKMNFASVSASSLTNGQTTLTITLPTTLTPSIFPLDLVIEEENNCLMPAGSEPVESGESSFAGKSNNYYFVKTIAYSDYYDVKTKTIKQDVFQVVLKTTRSLPSGGTNINIYDKKGYFNVTEVTVN